MPKAIYNGAHPGLELVPCELQVHCRANSTTASPSALTTTDFVAPNNSKHGNKNQFVIKHKTVAPLIKSAPLVISFCNHYYFMCFNQNLWSKPGAMCQTVLCVCVCVWLSLYLYVIFAVLTVHVCMLHVVQIAKETEIRVSHIRTN